MISHQTGAQTIIINLTWVRNHRQRRVTTWSCFVYYFYLNSRHPGTRLRPHRTLKLNKLREPLARNSFFSSLVFIVRKVIPCHVRVIIISLFYYFFFGHNIIKEKYFRESDCYCCAWYWSGVETWRALSTSHSINSSPHHWRSLIDGFVLLLIRSDVSKSNLVQTSHEGGRLDVASIAN